MKVFLSGLRIGIVYGAILVYWAIGVSGPVVVGAQRVVLISVDGLRPDALDLIDTPTFDRLIAEGAYAATALNDLPPATLPNHTTMVTGVNARTHGVLANTKLPGHVNRPTIFSIASEAGLTCAFFASKDKLGFLAPPELFLHREINGDMQAMHDAAIASFRDNPADLTFIHYRHPDSTGHATAWLSPEYLDAVGWVDRLLNELLDTLAEEKLLAETTILVTADHGGEGSGHVLNTPAVRHIPWIAYGAGIARGRALCPGINQPDTAATVLFWLGLPIPETWEGQPVLAALADRDPEPCAEQPESLGSPCMILMAPVFLLALAGLGLHYRGRRELLGSAPRFP